MSRTPINYHYHDDHYLVLKGRQDIPVKNIDPFNTSILITKGYTDSKQEDSGPCTYGTILDCGDASQNDRLYKIRVMKTGCIILEMAENIKITPIMVEQYCRPNNKEKQDRHLR